MENTKKPHYMGIAWKNVSQSGNAFYNLSINEKDIQELQPDEHGNIRATIAPKKETDEKTKATHNVYLNTYLEDGYKDKYGEINITFNKDNVLELKNEHNTSQLSLMPLSKNAREKDKSGADYALIQQPTEEQKESKRYNFVGKAFSVNFSKKQDFGPTEYIGRSFLNTFQDKESSTQVAYNNMVIDPKKLVDSINKSDNGTIYINSQQVQGYEDQFSLVISQSKNDKFAVNTYKFSKEDIDKINSLDKDDKGNIRLTATGKKPESIAKDKSHSDLVIYHENSSKEKTYIGKGWTKEALEKQKESIKEKKNDVSLGM